jgi:pilus assembly protein CpaF
MSGYIISVIGAKGGTGKSQIAGNLPFVFAQEMRGQCLLLDFDQKSCGDQNFITGMKSPKALNELAQFTGAIDPKSLQPFLANHPAKVSYISMSHDPIVANGIAPDNLGKFLKAATQIFPITIIDCGSELTPLALKALEFSTMILLVVNSDLLALNQTKRLYQDLLTLLYPKDMIQILHNQFQKGHPISPDVVGKQLGKAVLGIVPRDEATCIAAMDKKQPAVLMAKSSPFTAGILDFVRKVIQKSVLPTLAKLTKAPPPAAPQSQTSSQGGSSSSSPGQPGRFKTPWLDLKARIHRQLVEEMDLKKSGDDKDPKAMTILREQTKKMVIDLLNKEDTKGIISGRDDLNKMIKEVLDEALGLGPLEDLLADKSISEIMVNGPYKIYYEKGGKLNLSDVTFTTDRQVMNVIERIVAPIGRRIDEKTPYVDARLRDGSRVHAIIPPSAIDGCTITIRKFPDKRLTYKDLIQFGALTEGMADFLRIAVEGHRNVIVSGGTGSGKTSLVNILGSFIQADERIITCEDSAELSLPQEHIVRLETRPPTLEGDGEINIRTLVKQTLRMRPDRIIVGECRGGETLDMLQAMGTGHDGSLTTVHSNNPRECIGRLETLVQYAGAGLTPKAIREMIASAVHLIIQAQRLDDGSRKITHISEVGGMQGDVVTLQDIFLYHQEGIDKNGKVIGKFQATGFIPKFIEKLERKGYKIPRNIFNNT